MDIEMKTKLIKVFEDKRSGALFVRATNDKFRLKPHKYGKALGKNASNDELGKTIRQIFNNCD